VCNPAHRRGIPSLLLAWLPTARSAFSSEPEKVEEPAGSNHVGSQCLSPSSQLAVCGDQGDCVIGALCHDIDQRIVATATGVHDCDTVGLAGGRTLASLAFEDHDDWLGDLPRSNGGPELADERAGCSCSVLPPTGWPRSDDVGCINEKHALSLPVQRGGSRQARRQRPARDETQPAVWWYPPPAPPGAAETTAV
jgi:hypothetical protein